MDHVTAWRVYKSCQEVRRKTIRLQLACEEKGQEEMGFFAPKLFLDKTSWVSLQAESSMACQLWILAFWGPWMWPYQQGLICSSIQKLKILHTLRIWKVENIISGIPWQSSGYDSVLPPVQGARVRSLVGELRSHKPHGTARPRNK